MKHLIIITTFVGMAACTLSEQTPYHPCPKNWDGDIDCGGGHEVRNSETPNDQAGEGAGEARGSDSGSNGRDRAPDTDGPTDNPSGPDGPVEPDPNPWPDGVFCCEDDFVGGNPGNDRPVGNAGESPNGEDFGGGDRGMSH